MKILLVRTFPDVLNVSNYNSQELGLARAFAKLGHKCDIVYYCGDEPDHDESFPSEGEPVVIHWLHGRAVFKNAIFPSLDALLPQYDIIQTNGYDQYTSWKLYTGKNPNVTLYHGTYLSDFNRKYKMRTAIFDALFMIRHKDRVRRTPCFTKSGLAEQFLRTKGFTDVTAVGVGFDAERLERGGEESEWVKKLRDEKGDRRYLLYIGHIDELRDTLFLLRAAARAMIADERIELVIVGKGEEEYTKKCRELAESLGISSKIHYQPSLPQSQLKALYEASDAFLLPSRHEIFGMVLLEAMYFEVPAITTYNGGSQMMIRDGENGFIIGSRTEEDEKKWAERALEIAAGKYPEMGRAASRTVRENYMWLPIARRMLERYQRMLDEKGVKERGV
ncbi:MAG: glycosyltransferase family 4 protein [Clostridia bacterium]|nr:glycosyltransferase family 4 protein [Clostridia bacterium]